MSNWDKFVYLLNILCGIGFALWYCVDLDFHKLIIAGIFVILVKMDADKISRYS